MSNIDPSTIDPTKPENYPATALSQDQRDNWAATQTQLATARDEITAVEAHVATVSGNPHALDANDVGADAAGTAAAAVAAHEALGDPHPVYLTPTEGDARYDPAGTAAAAVGAHEGATDPHPVYLTQAEGDTLYEPVGALRSVADDTSPQLGGNLGTEGFAIFLRRTDLTDRGVLVALDPLDGAGLIYTRDGAYAPDDGGVTVEPSRVRLWGSAAVVEGLKHATAGGRPAYVSEDGTLFTVDPPTPGWTRSDTSIATADLGAGTTPGPWADTDLTLPIGDDVEIGQRLDVSVSLHIENLTSRAGTISVGFGLNAAQPTGPSATVSIGAYFVGWVPVSFSTVATAPLTVTDNFDVFVRRETGTHAQFHPFLQYEGTDPHEGVLSTPGTGGGGVAGVSSFNGRSGAVTSQAGDYDAGQVGADPAGTAAAAITAHEGAADPHPVYLTAAEGDAAYDPIGSAAAAVAAHEGAADPHPVYLTSAEGDAAYDPIGSAAAAVAAHEGAADPHTQYLPEVGGVEIATDDAHATTGGLGSKPRAIVNPAGTITPNPRTENYIEFSGTGTPTVAPPANDGAVLIAIPAAMTVATGAGFSAVIGSADNASAHKLYVEKIGALSFATWVTA